MSMQITESPSHFPVNWGWVAIPDLVSEVNNTLGGASYTWEDIYHRFLPLSKDWLDLAFWDTDGFKQGQRYRPSEVDSVPAGWALEVAELASHGIHSVREADQWNRAEKMGDFNLLTDPYPVGYWPIGSGFYVITLDEEGDPISVPCKEREEYLRELRLRKKKFRKAGYYDLSVSLPNPEISPVFLETGWRHLNERGKIWVIFCSGESVRLREPLSSFLFSLGRQISEVKAIVSKYLEWHGGHYYSDVITIARLPTHVRRKYLQMDRAFRQRKAQ